MIERVGKKSALPFLPDNRFIKERLRRTKKDQKVFHG